MKRLLIVSTDKYPNGDAGSLREHAYAKIAERCGYSPFVIGLGESTGFQCKEHEGVSYTSFRAPNNHLANRVLNLLLFKRRLARFLKQNPGFAKIIVVSIPRNALFYLKEYARGGDVRLFHDSVEWYSPEQFALGVMSPVYISNNAYNTQWIDDRFAVIAISKYLQTHYLSRNIRTIRVPVILDIHSMACNKMASAGRLILVYAGTVGRKDYLGQIIRGLSLLEPAEISKVELRIFGVSDTQLRNDIGVDVETIKRLSSSLKCFGRVLREDVLRNLEEADFTVLLRSPTQRYAEAGFPTKVVESLASATPVILNLTSDLGDYLIDMENSIVVPDCTAESFRGGLQKAMEMKPEERRNMQANARQTAERYFDYSSYEDVFRDFM